MERIEQKIQERFLEKKWTLALAESCTGGALAARLVEIPDCSLYFLGSVVAYSNSAKQALLGVSQATIESHGAVSEEVAEEMAKGALKRLGAEVALAITGIAGPSGGSPDKPVGTVSFAIAWSQGQIQRWTCHFEGERGEIITQSVDEALHQLYNT